MTERELIELKDKAEIISAIERLSRSAKFELCFTLMDEEKAHRLFRAVLGMTD